MLTEETLVKIEEAMKDESFAKEMATKKTAKEVVDFLKERKGIEASEEDIKAYGEKVAKMISDGELDASGAGTWSTVKTASEDFWTGFKSSLFLNKEINGSRWDAYESSVKGEGGRMEQLGALMGPSVQRFAGAAIVIGTIYGGEKFYNKYLKKQRTLPQPIYPY